MHLALSPVFLGKGEHLFSGINLDSLGFQALQNRFRGKCDSRSY